MNVHVRTPRGWTDEAAQVAAQLWREGYSGTAIGGQIGKTRCAVLGFVNRSGLPPRLVTVRKPHYEPVTERGRNQVREAQQIAKSKVWHPLDNSTPVTLTDKQRHQCSWPVGEGLFCGETKLNERPYCPIHCRVAYEPRKKSSGYMRLQSLEARG